MSWEHLKLNPVDVKDDSHTLQVEMPASVTDDVMWMIAELGKIVEQGNASLNLHEVDGRPTLFLTIRQPNFPSTMGVTTNKIEILKSILGRDLVLEKDGELVKETLYPAASIVQRIAEDCSEETPLASMSGEEEAEKSESDK